MMTITLPRKLRYLGLGLMVFMSMFASCRTGWETTIPSPAVGDPTFGIYFTETDTLSSDPVDSAGGFDPTRTHARITVTDIEVYDWYRQIAVLREGVRVPWAEYEVFGHVGDPLSRFDIVVMGKHICSGAIVLRNTAIWLKGPVMYVYGPDSDEDLAAEQHHLASIHFLARGGDGDAESKLHLAERFPCGDARARESVKLLLDRLGKLK